MKSIFILIATCLTIISGNKNITNQSTVECSSELSVEKNRNIKYAFEGDINFSMSLKNTSTNTATYSLSIKTLEEACDNISKNEFSKNNLDFDISLQTNNLKNEVTLNGGEIFDFIVTVKIPKGTPSDNYSCIEVLAQSNDCENLEPTSSIISIYIPDPSQG